MSDEVRLVNVNTLLNKIDEINPVDYGGIYNYEAHVAARSVLADVKLIINNTSTIEAEPDNGWINVEDRLPDECEEVLIYCPEFLEEIRKACYTEGVFYIEKEDLIVEPDPSECTHWMPLPKPPKGE